MVEQYFQNFGSIDHNDRKRQGDLAFHLHWATKTWWYRFFSTIYGVMITDAYYMYMFEVKEYLEEKDNVTYMKFCDKPAGQQIHYMKPISCMAQGNDQVEVPKVYEV